MCDWPTWLLRGGVWCVCMLSSPTNSWIVLEFKVIWQLEQARVQHLFVHVSRASYSVLAMRLSRISPDFYGSTCRRQSNGILDQYFRYLVCCLPIFPTIWKHPTQYSIIMVGGCALKWWIALRRTRKHDSVAERGRKRSLPTVWLSQRVISPHAG